MSRAPLICVYGAPGTGKSRWAINSDGPRLLLDTESAGGYLPGPLAFLNTDGQPPPDLTPDTTVIADCGVSGAHKLTTLMSTLAADPSLPFRTVILDSLSAWHERIVDHYSRAHQDPGFGQPPFIAMCQQIARPARAVLDGLNALGQAHPDRPPITVIITSREHVPENPRDDDPSIRPAIFGKTRHELAHTVSLLLRLETRDTGRVLVGRGESVHTGSARQRVVLGKVRGPLGDLLDWTAVPADQYGPGTLAAMQLDAMHTAPLPTPPQHATADTTIAHDTRSTHNE